MKRIFWLPPKFEVLCRVLKVFKMYLSCYSLCLRNKYTVKITYIYTSNLHGDIINLQMDAMDITWILMAPSSKWGYENIRHRQSIGTYFLILAHMEVFSELSAGCLMTIFYHRIQWKHLGKAPMILTARILTVSTEDFNVTENHCCGWGFVDCQISCFNYAWIRRNRFKSEIRVVLPNITSFYRQIWHPD